ncbi:cytochrome C oxidase subunit IV family protein [Aeoliella sp. ICT_H6.2]|uniref:Cytochrome C oxidase subunit IV family protein n=1 Tax=Aeoliella straminimaris TaxID=2954799 RepID=A0A9X2JF89_9BACT|nr:cytochrome C oxidase subunit IV family protein [Aeoliella straminimaris]MCO6043047.1 cytochrome C oxidase subunit IV family protein [Aeoliella straminimaris]
MSENHSHYVTPLPVLLGTFLALVGLTVLTVYQATQDHVDFGRFEVGLTLLIAAVKAILVAVIFMQLAHDKPMNSIILVSSILFVALFLSITLMDRAEYKPQVDDYVIQHPKTADSL